MVAKLLGLKIDTIEADKDLLRVSSPILKHAKLHGKAEATQDYY